MRTFTGIDVDPVDPLPSEIRIEDIARSLSMICRFGGHLREFYSVAQHSVIVSENVPPQLSLHALLHDSAEAYMFDAVQPLKKQLVGYVQHEENVLRVVYEALGLRRLSDLEKHIIKLADYTMFAWELRDLHPHPWDTDVVSFISEILPCNWQDAEMLFLNRYKELTTEE